MRLIRIAFVSLLLFGVFFSFIAKAREYERTKFCAVGSGTYEHGICIFNMDYILMLTDPIIPDAAKESE